MTHIADIRLPCQVYYTIDWQNKNIPQHGHIALMPNKYSQYCLIKAATQKLAAINAAYEAIVDGRRVEGERV